MRHEQNGREKLYWLFFKINKGSTQNSVSKDYSCEYIVCEENGK